MRVVSLLPSATELLCVIGAADLLVGRSHECDYPPTIVDRPILTARRTIATTSGEIDAAVRDALGDGQPLYTVDDDHLRDLQPDVILTQDLCSVCSIDLHTVRAIARAMSPAPTIVSLNPQTVEDVFDDVLRIGDAVDRSHDAQRAMVELRGRYWSAIDHVNGYIEGPRVVVLEWLDPLFIAGHWTPQLVTQAGARHDLNAAGAPSRPITAEELVANQPERIVICPCGFSLGETRRDVHHLTSQEWWSELPAVRAGHVVLMDGNQMLSRPGPRLVDAFEFLVGWLNGVDLGHSVNRTDWVEPLAV